ncbi:hypothetical protein PC129_g10026 [Phytophthora cactorum]|uniref:Uncharacterized protein n=1 Tax=Phytophthora cactorum TaxID=29920 RepID=A0A329SM39_9STRA|nr:hypothetical protein Pcac1_g13936 [Phytophthora cactorum]KAG2830385.1 hypothetical protein PC112_g7698 [Phytophthora cactorum]KAG2832792.1 hypothetical protein PC111_g6452 [Phytophthora cactorum]KAG2860678.1 hypothetical protein PC113_g7846 [Phytophthora cactorum]KAG2902406.1 hypothetical protein PC114_g12768 [Phytophthora cactorum]
MASAVAFTVDALAPQDDLLQIHLRIESKDASNGNWQCFQEESVTLKDVNIVSQLNRAQYAYRLSLRPASETQQAAAFPFYLEAPVLPPSPSSSEEGDMCPPEIGTFAIAAEQLQCPAEEQARDLTSASQVAAMFGGTLAAALLVCSLLPYVRARNRKRRRSRSRSHSQTSQSSDRQEVSTPTTPNGASRRMWGSLDGDGIEPAGAYRAELREKKNRQPEATGSAVTGAGSEFLLAKLPDFNDERGWRDFFDSQIYHDEPQEEQRAATKAFSSIKNRFDGTPREPITATHKKLRQTKTTAASPKSPRSARYRTIRDRIDRAAMEAAMDEAQTFNEFWQM